MIFTVRQGRRYRAHVRLGFFEKLASNAAVAEKFKAAGFAHVEVVGEGAERWAFGTWTGPDATAELPSEITDVPVEV